MDLYSSILDIVGNTPMVRLTTGMDPDGPKAYAKLEYQNPTGSVKDRMALHIIRKAVEEGRLKRGDTVVDNTSGNTGSSLAFVATLFGLKAVLTTPEKTSKEKVDLIKSYGARVIVTPTEASHDDPEGCFMMARQLAIENGWFDLNQYDSQENVEAHYLTTGPEIWNDTGGRVTHFVAGIGTGGTMSGVARYLKEQNPDVTTVAVDPEGSIFAEYIHSRKVTEGSIYKVEGIGSDVVTGALHPDLIDSVITVSDSDSFRRAREVTSCDGISAGGSSGAVAVAIEKVARSAESDALIVGIFADSGIRYLSKCYNDEWMVEQGFLNSMESGK
ncbi:MAG: PLP-dependent cysteine synthase family protein [Candidatus Zixiibacteriota bacterium]